MLLSSLPDECFSDILSYLDRESLYQCLFVSRHYCKFSIPVIWRDPFIAPKSKKLSLINTLFTCLNEDEISSLIPCALNFNNNQSPLFGYGKFVRKIDHDYCIRHIRNWLVVLNGVHEYDVNQDCRVRKLVSAIFHMIMRENSNLQEFVIETWESYVVLPKLSIFTTYKPGISNLRSLTMDVDFDINEDELYQNTVEFLNMVSKFCKSIVNYNLYIVELNNSYSKPFLDIIELQPLEMLLISIEEQSKGGVEKVLNALEFRSETLKELLFRSLDFQDINLSFLSKLEWLERLEFESCRGFTSQYSDTLFKRKLHLKVLKLWHHEADFWNGSIYGFGDIKLNVIEAMINSFCNKTLLKLSLNIITSETVKAARESCSNINFLHIKIYPGQLLDSIIPPICELPSLKTLIIDIGCGVQADPLVRILGDHLTFVECLLLEFYIELPSFEYFVNNCKANLKKWIMNTDIYSIRRQKDYLVHMNYYQKVHNSLKVLGINRFDWTNEELEVINSLKNQGVEITLSSSLILEIMNVLT